MDQRWGVGISGGSVERGNLTPDREALIYFGSPLGRAEQMPSWSKVRGDGAKGRQEPLGMPHLFKAFHRPVEGRHAIRDMFRWEFGSAEMTCIPEVIHEAGDVAILEWRDPLGLRGCGFFTIREARIAFQRGYWDRLSFLRLHRLPIPPE